MFYLVGLGPGPGFVTERAVQILREADCVFYEDYTGPLDISTLARLAKRAPVRLTRRDLEDGGGRKILDCLDGGNAAVLVTAGDPMAATTHGALVASIRARGHRVEIVPGVSIVCAAFSASCLSIYKLGGIATITYPRLGVYSARPYELAEQNLARGLHTLLLLDVREDGGFMPPRDAAEILLKLEEREGRGLFTPEREIVVVYRLGWGGGAIYTSIDEVRRGHLEAPAVFIVPSRLGPVEGECLKALRLDTPPGRDRHV
ncbi:MAG: SAM-dependent methyltransferase [Pyrobaculum sp.]